MPGNLVGAQKYYCDNSVKILDVIWIDLQKQSVQGSQDSVVISIFSIHAEINGLILQEFYTP